MQAAQPLSFGPYRLDPEQGQLWRGTQSVRLTPKALTVLRTLVEHAGQVVTKEALFHAVWPDTVVSDAALTACIHELRDALRDDARKPRYIETVHRRGFRFIAPFSTQPVRSPESGVRSQNFQPTPTPQHPAPTLVGRETELAQLHHWLGRALHGERQIIFVSGEPGIGKTTLVDAFLSEVQNPESEVAERPKENQNSKGKGQKAKVSNSHPPTPNPQHPAPSPWLGHGQCIEHYGAGEAYLPILSALGQLCRTAEGEQLVRLLSQHAPTWLMQMPALLNAADLEALQRKTAGATKERMLREMAEAMEVITAKRPLVLVLEDLHWSDPSTLDLLAFVARRSQPAWLLLIGTYRPAEMLAKEHPLRGVVHELQLHRLCQELPVPLLSEAAVEEYLAERVAALPSPPAREGQDGGDRPSMSMLAWVIHQRTEGNPLFMVNVVDDLLARGEGESANVEINAPTTIRQMIERQFERLSPADQQLIETASVTGIEFSAAAVAAGSEAPIEAVERHCAALAQRRQFLHTAGVGEWPDGTVASRYTFQHALYQEVLYDRVPAAQKVTLHRRIGEREEQAYGKRAKEIATELAVHFERGRDYRRATRYLQHAAENAERKNAHQEAISLATRGLQLLPDLSDTPERVQQELRLQLALARSLTAIKGYAAPEVEKTYNQALTLCREVGETPQLFSVLGGLAAFHIIRGELRVARELEERQLRMAQSAQYPVLLHALHSGLGEILWELGELVESRAHLEQAIILYNPQPRHFLAIHDMGVACLSIAALTLWVLGYPDQSLQRLQESLTLAQEQSHQFSVAYALYCAATLYQYRREGKATQEQAETLIALSHEQGFTLREASGVTLRGWALAEQGRGEEGLAQIRQGLAAIQATGAELIRTLLIPLLAAAYVKAGWVEEGLSVVAEALALMDKTESRVHEAELYRLKGELMLKQESQKPVLSVVEGAKGKSQKAKITNPQSLIPNSQGEAEACFHKAIDIARKQQAKSLELRAATSLARLWQQQGKQKEAHQMLAEIYSWFTEGFDTIDLKEAKALLEALGRDCDT